MINNILKFYNRAVRTAILAQDNTTKQWYVVFSVIELLTPDIPNYQIPSSGWREGKIMRSSLASKSDTYSFYLVVHPLDSPETAYQLFQNPGGPQEIDGILTHSFGNNFIKEPNSESPLILPSTIYLNDSLSSVLPKRSSGMFVWSQIDTDRIAYEMFSQMSSREGRAISQLTTEWLGFDLILLSEHLGNQYLAAVNPYYRHFDLTLSDVPTGINYNFYFRNGIREKIYARVIDVHGDHISVDKMFHIDDSIGIFELPHEPLLSEVRIYNDQHDLIGYHQPATFIKSISFNMSIKTADFHVNFQNGDKTQEHTIEKFSKASSDNIGKPPEFNAAYYFKDAEKGRKHLRLAESKDFIFFKVFKDEQEKANLRLHAKKAIRDIINQAQDVCYLCDPYFNVSDLVEFAFYSKNTSAELRIINCKGSSFVNRKKAADLLEGIKKYNENFNKITCHMLKGDSILHDRFIVADRKVWFIGSSFSEFGSRATCIARVPESADKEIAFEIEKWYFNSGAPYTISIENYVTSTSDE